MSSVKFKRFLCGSALFVALPFITSPAFAEEGAREYYMQFAGNECRNEADKMGNNEWSVCMGEAEAASVRDLEKTFKEVLGNIDSMEYEERGGINEKQWKSDLKKDMKQAQSYWEKQREIMRGVTMTMTQGAQGSGATNIEYGFLMDMNYRRVKELREDFSLGSK